MPTHQIRTALRQYFPYIAGVLALNLLLWLAFEAVRPRGLTWDGLWNARTAIWAGLLLLDNLLVLWWYAHLTKEVAESSATQARISERQLRDAQRPCVVIDWQLVPRSRREDPDGNTYVARNVGRGLALNVIYVEDLDATALEPLHIGALESGQAVRLPQALVDVLNREAERQFDRKRRVLIAEPVGGDEWVVSENLMERGGRVSHRVRSRTLRPDQIDQIHRETAAEYIHRHWAAIQGELNAMLRNLQQ